jgi:hypothetical protein
MYLDKIISEASRASINTAEVTNAVTTVITGSGKNLSVASNNNWWSINKGPIYELAVGVTPSIDFCKKSIISTAHCANKYVVRDFVDKYHLQYKTFHIKYIKEIEPRGTKGCYYKFTKVTFDKNTNLEGTIEEEEEVILDHEFKDYATCTYTPLNIVTNVSDNVLYPIRSYVDPGTAGSIPVKMIYPTRDTVYTSDLVARFVRIRPPVALGDGLLNLVQLAVFDISGNNISSQMPTYATSVDDGAGNADSVVNGTAASSSFLSGVWQPSSKDRGKEYWEVDLGANINIAEVVYMGSEIVTPIAIYDTTIGTPQNLTVPPGTGTAVNTVPATAQGRYVRIMGPSSTTTKGALGLTQIIVTDINGYNIALGKPVFASSRNPTINRDITTRYITDGSLTPRAYPNCFYVITDLIKYTPETEFIEVDLGDIYNIASVTVIQDPNHTSLNTTEDRISGTRIKISNTTTNDALALYTGAGSRSGSNYISNGRNIGVRIEFLYTNGANDTPIYTISLPKDDTVQYIPIYSSIYTKPTHPIAGPIRIPRPVLRTMILSPTNGCVNKCEDRGVIDSLITQYNDKYYDYSSIAGGSLLQTGSNEYTLPAGTPNQSISIPNVSARYIAILPSLISGDGWINLRQVFVMDSNGNNVALGKTVRTTSICNRCADGTAAFQTGSTVVDGNANLITMRNTVGTFTTFTNVWQPATGNRTTEALEIDLGSTVVITSIIVVGRTDCCNATAGNDRMKGLRIQANTVSKFLSSSSEIVKILRGTTATTTKCEYEAEVLMKDSSDSMGSDETTILGTQSIVRQYLSMDVTPSSAVAGPIVSGRYIRFIPSFTPGSVLEVYNVIVYSAVADGTTGRTKAGQIISNGRTTSSYNELYILNEGGNRRLDASTTSAYGPSIFRARDNDPATYFEIDLGDVSNGSGSSNQNIYSITFVGQADRTPGGIEGVEVQVYKDIRGEDPIYRFMLGSQTVTVDGKTQLAGDAEIQTIILSPPAKCQFSLGDTTALPKPIYLMDASGGIFTTTDTSGGVFTVSTIIGNLQSAWGSALSGVMNTQDLTAPITANVKESDAIAKSILETVSASKVIGSTGLTCKDPTLMNKMILAYNISRGLADTDTNGLLSKMSRILKSGQSTNSTCDVLFEESYEIYDDYIIDIKDPKKKGTQISAVRFKIGPTGVPVADVPGAAKKNIIDISSNSLGVLTNASMVSPPFSWSPLPAVSTSSSANPYPLNTSGQISGVNCMSPAILSQFRPIVEGKTRQYNNTYTIRSTLKSVAGVFQSTPLTCEYLLLKDDSYTHNNMNYTSSQNGVETVIKVMFTLGSDGLSAVFKSIEEYYSGDITQSQDFRNFMDNPRREVTLPNMSYYDSKKSSSTRVNKTGYTFT